MCGNGRRQVVELLAKNGTAQRLASELTLDIRVESGVPESDSDKLVCRRVHIPAQ
jgi:diaminopimelate epimerase